MTEERRSALGSTSAVQRVMQRGAERQEEAQIKPYAGRGKPGHGGQKGQDKTGRHKLTADVAPGRKEQVDTMARALGISASDVVDVALAHMITVFGRGSLDLADYKAFIPDSEKPGRGIWKLALPEDFEFET